MESLKIEYIPVGKLKPYEKNARKHKDFDVDAIVRSIEEFGFSDPIGIWSDKNIIVEGHGRLMAAKKLGMTEVPCIRLDHLTDEQRRAYALAHNKTAENSEWDLELLPLELEEIVDIDMTQFGFDVPEDEPEIEEDEIPEVSDEPQAKLGDIYQLGRHWLMCGDSTSEADVRRLMNGDEADLVLTDPPYGISVVGGDKAFGKVGGGNIVESHIYSAIIGDDTTDTAQANYEIVKELSKNQIIFGGNYFTEFLAPSRCWVVWDKQNTGNFADAELAWTSFDKSVRLYHFLWNGLCREGSREVEGKTRVHPTQKPVGLMANIIKDFSEDGANVLDCFGGSGSTLIACEQTNRNCYMMELDPHYVDVIIARWENLTGEKAVLLNE